MSANKNFVGDWRLNPKAPSFETSESKTLTKIISNQNEDIFSLNNQHPSKAPLQHFYPRDGWMISLIISNEISQPLVSPSHPGSYWSSVASLPDTVL